MKTNSIEISFDGQRLDVPVIELGGQLDGPHAFISSGMHGNEINGIATVRRFLEWFDKEGWGERLRGRITVLPVLNPSGFAHMQRRVFEDNQDPNRSFGFDPAETLSQHIANVLTKEVFRECDFGIDVHDAGVGGALVPHCRVHAGEDDSRQDNTTHMGRLLGTRIIIRRQGNPHMLAVHLQQSLGLPVLTVELGGCQRLFPDYIEETLVGIRNVLVFRDMIDGTVSVPDHQYFLSERFGANVPEPCELEFSVQLGDTVHAGDRLGRIYYALRNREEEIISPMCGFVFSLYQFNQAPANQRIYSILETDHCHVDRKTLDKFEELAPLDVKKVRM